MGKSERTPRCLASVSWTHRRKARCLPNWLHSWCYFQKQKAQHLEDSSIPFPSIRSPYLSTAELKRTVDVFAAFASLDFCQTITLGKTQNSNESLHNTLWHNAPKSKRAGHKSLKVSTALAVLSFNEGSMSYSRLMKDLGLTCSHESLVYTARRDRLRNLSRVRRIHETQKRRRREIASQTKLAEKSRKRRDKGIYASERFGSEVLSSGNESDVLCAGCQNRECPVPSRIKYEGWVSCHDCEDWFHWGCVGIATKRGLPEYFFCTKCKS